MVPQHKVRITLFTIDLYDDVLALWQGCEGVGLRAESDSREAIGAYLARNLGMSFVAVAGNAVVGAVLGGHDGRRGYLHHLAVHPQYREQGVGRRLVQHCLDALAAAGITKAHIFIFAENAAGIAFWRAIGWTPRTDLDVMSTLIESYSPQRYGDHG